MTVTSVLNKLTSSNSQNIPGAEIRISGTGFSTTLTDNVITVSGTAATVLTATSTSITFTMPEIASITENQTVNVVVTKGTSTATGTLTYFPTPTITLNATNSISRTLNPTGRSGSHWYKFTTLSTNTIINVSGYTGRDIDFYIFSVPTSTYSTSAISTITNAESGKFTSLSAATTYYIEVVLYSGTATTYNIGMASQAVTSAGSCSSHGTTSKCIDYLFNNTASQTDCTTNGGTYTAGGTCVGLGLGTIVGKCTIPSGTNIGTVNYYSNGGSAFSAGSAGTNCNGLSSSIFQ